MLVLDGKRLSGVSDNLFFTTFVKWIETPFCDRVVGDIRRYYPKDNRVIIILEA